MLSIFNETELEVRVDVCTHVEYDSIVWVCVLKLLMCGTSVFKFEDFKSHTIKNGTGDSFNKVVSWFWAIVSNFTQEEMARYGGHIESYY